MNREFGNVVTQLDTPLPLCVDLDGSLVAQDTFYQSVFALLTRNFFFLFLLPFWMLKGKAFVKHKVAQHYQLPVASLSYNAALLGFLKQEYAKGRDIYLCTGTNIRVAQAVASHVGLFADVLASTPSLNLTGERKAKVLVDRFGADGFDYVGNSKVDVAVWREAHQALVVGPKKAVLQAAEAVSQVAETFDTDFGRDSARILDYVSIARPDHWFKNVFVLPGALLAAYFFKVSPDTTTILSLVVALAACCLVASSNYVINELLDAERDRHHPVKKARPLAAGRISQPVACLEWLILGMLGVTLGFVVNSYVGGSCLFLWVMGLIYNVPPIRSKELPFLDVLSESINNPIRMALGWYAMGVVVMPPISALFAYWMFGAFLMATKRLAEYRRIGNKELAAQYRKSFSYYDEERLVVGTVFYVSLFMTGSVVFMMLYRLELVLAVPFISYLLAYYLYLGFKPDSPVQYPERLYKDVNLMIAVAFTTALCLTLFVVDVPAFRELFVLLAPN